MKPEERLGFSLFCPTVLASSDYADDIPKDVTEKMKIERLLNPDRTEATDTEALAYLYSASLMAPLSAEAGRIYRHLFTKHLKSKGLETPEELKVESLDESEKRGLEQLKRMIYQDQEKAFRERHKKGEKNGKQYDRVQ